VKNLEIVKVTLDPADGLLVHPRMDGRPSYEHFYREANGMRWNHEKQAFHAYEPLRWKAEELLSHIASTLRSCCDEELRFTEKTEWQGVSPELRAGLLSALADTQGS
jgi:hypothetical protein